MATIYYLTWHHSGPTDHTEASERFHEYHTETPVALSEGEFAELYEVIGEYDADDPEDIWRAYNRGSGREAFEFLQKEIRSMSVGDIVEIDGEYYMAASFGWNSIDIRGGDDQ
jgi:hypothetical protein